jgi:hypothetical protein
VRPDCRLPLALIELAQIPITNAIRTAFIRDPEGDGGPNDEAIVPDQSTHIAKAILKDSGS